MKQDQARAMRNRARRSVLKTEVRRFLDAVHENDVSAATEQFRKVTKILDRTAALGTFHKNTVSRRKSRLAARLNALSAGKAGK
jgi:small subunit ribosomal protein S20